MKTFKNVAAAAMIGAGLCMATAASAEESQFGYVYTTDLLPKGANEIEQWATWRHQKIGGQFDEIEGRTEVEHGITDRLQVALYVNYAWAQAYHNGPDGQTTPPEQFADKNVDPDAHWHGTRFVGVSGEAIYRVLSPYQHPFGLALYVEPVIGPAFREVETKIILQKNFLDDKLITAFNFTYAPEWRHVDDASSPSGKNWQEETDINFNVAASYRFRPNWSFGAEFVNEHEYNSFNFTHESNNGYFVGPSLHYGGQKFFVTATFLKQLPWAKAHTDTVAGSLVNGYVLDNDYEKSRLRIKVGYYF